MVKKNPQVDTYLSSLGPERHAALERIRSLAFETVPDIKETMKYRMPTYELGEVVFAIASQKHHMSLYMDTSLVEKYKQALEGLDCGKSCIRFKRLEDLPLDTITRIIKETVSNQKDR